MLIYILIGLFLVALVLPILIICEIVPEPLDNYTLSAALLYILLFITVGVVTIKLIGG